MEIKVCTKCKREKAVVEFYKNRSKKDGYASWCKDCHGTRFGRKYMQKYQRRYVQRLASGAIPRHSPLTKMCSGCDEEKAISEFHRARGKKDGHQGYCRQCSSNYQKSETGRESVKRYYTSKHGKRRIARRERRFPERRKAVRAAHRAKVNGVLAEPASRPCFDCGRKAHEYHHESYESPHWLNVIPLCYECHKARHVRKLDPLSDS